MTTGMSLEEALRQCLSDDNKISKYEAKVIRELIMADGQISDAEKKFLETALHSNQFDNDAFELLSGILLRSHMKE